MWRLGAKIAQWLGKGCLLFFKLVVPINLAVAGILLKSFEHLWPVVTWPLSGLLLQGFVVYVGEASAEQDRRAKEAAGEAQEAALLRYKRDTAGNLARLLRTLLMQTNDIRTIQSQFLRQAVDAVKDYLALDRHDERITATWVVPIEEYTRWETVAYDKDRAHRQLGTKREIKKGIPGAAEAFLTGGEVLIPDTTDEKVARWFKPNPPYRSILSVPARIRNTQEKSNVTIENIDDEKATIIGVLNIDSTEPNLLREDVSNVVQDIAYLIAVLEHLGGSHEPK